MFHNPVCNDLLRQYVHSPQQCKAAEAQEIAATINDFGVQIMRALTETQFLEFSFLSESDPFEDYLRQHFRAKYPDVEALVLQTSADPTLFEMIEHGYYFDALQRLFGRRTFNREFWDMDMLTTAVSLDSKCHSAPRRDLLRDLLIQARHDEVGNSLNHLSIVYSWYFSPDPREAARKHCNNLI